MHTVNPLTALLDIAGTPIRRVAVDWRDTLRTWGTIAAQSPVGTPSSECLRPPHRRQRNAEGSAADPCGCGRGGAPRVVAVPSRARAAKSSAGGDSRVVSGGGGRLDLKAGRGHCSCRSASLRPSGRAWRGPAPTPSTGCGAEIVPYGSSIRDRPLRQRMSPSQGTWSVELPRLLRGRSCRQNDRFYS